MSKEPKHPDPKTCSYCGGKGTIPAESDGRPGKEPQEVTCPHCQGTGQVR